MHNQQPASCHDAEHCPGTLKTHGTNVRVCAVEGKLSSLSSPNCSGRVSLLVVRRGGRPLTPRPKVSVTTVQSHQL